MFIYGVVFEDLLFIKSPLPFDTKWHPANDAEYFSSQRCYDFVEIKRFFLLGTKYWGSITKGND